MDARAEMPTPPKTSGYLPVEDLPPKRQIMTADEQSKLKNELIAARARGQRILSVLLVRRGSKLSGSLP